MKKESTCIWNLKKNYRSKTSCGKTVGMLNLFVVNRKKNDAIRFCPLCGGKIMVVGSRMK